MQDTVGMIGILGSQMGEMQVQMGEMQSEVRGLQQENRRILDILLNQQQGTG